MSKALFILFYSYYGDDCLFKSKQHNFVFHTNLFKLIIFIEFKNKNNKNKHLANNNCQTVIYHYHFVYFK